MVFDSHQQLVKIKRISVQLYSIENMVIYKTRYSDECGDRNTVLLLKDMSNVVYTQEKWLCSIS